MAADQGAEAAEALIGATGVEYLANALAKRGPPAIAEIQERCGLRPPLCRPVIGMLDQIGISRADAHQYVLHRAKKVLLDRIPAMGTEQLEGLLEASFPYLGIEELRSVPIRVMERIQLVPPNYLKLLAEDKAIFQHLPPKVQQEVWEFDQNLLQLDAMPLVASYKYEIATVQQTIKMDEFLDWAQLADYEERRDSDEAPPEVAQRKVRGWRRQQQAWLMGGGRGRGLRRRAGRAATQVCITAARCEELGSGSRVWAGRRRWLPLPLGEAAGAARSHQLLTAAPARPVPLPCPAGDAQDAAHAQQGHPDAARHGGLGAASPGRRASRAAARSPLLRARWHAHLPRARRRPAGALTGAALPQVGTSESIYSRIKDLITRRYRDSETLYFGTKELSVCILRSQVGRRRRVP
jgi:hypothetical protein